MIAYDFDGVLCEGPNIPGDPNRALTKEERTERYPELCEHFSNAKPILRIDSAIEKFLVITARPEDPIFRQRSEEWLTKHYGSRWVGLIMCDQEDRSKQGIAEFKKNEIQRHGVTEFTDDNSFTCDYLKDLCKGVKINHFLTQVDI